MKKMMIIPIIFIFSLLFSFSSSQPSAVSDFCVADYSAPYGPAGYSCKNPRSVNSNDFYGSGVLNAPNTANVFRTGISIASVNNIAGMNSLGVSLALVHIQPNGVVPLHTHPDSSEILTVLQGNITAGFISSNNTVYMKSLAKGDVFVFPRGLLHFQVNSGNNLSVGIVAFSSSNPNTQIFDFAMFQSNLSSPLITATTFINILEVRRLKIVFGGSG